MSIRATTMTEHALTGCASVECDHPRYIVRYTDGAWESCDCPELLPDASALAIIAAVQARRGRARFPDKPTQTNTNQHKQHKQQCLTYHK